MHGGFDFEYTFCCCFLVDPNDVTTEFSMVFGHTYRLPDSRFFLFLRTSVRDFESKQTRDDRCTHDGAFVFQFRYCATRWDWATRTHDLYVYAEIYFVTRSRTNTGPDQRQKMTVFCIACVRRLTVISGYGCFWKQRKVNGASRIPINVYTPESWNETETFIIRYAPCPTLQRHDVSLLWKKKPYIFVCVWPSVRKTRGLRKIRW